MQVNDIANSNSDDLFFILLGGLIKRAGNTIRPKRMGQVLSHSSLFSVLAGDDHFATGYGGSGSPGFKKLGKRAPPGDASSSSSSSSLDTADFRWVLGSNPDMYRGPLYELPLASVNTNDVDSPFWKVLVKGLALVHSGGANGTQMGPQEFPFSKGTIGEVASSLADLLIPGQVADTINEALGAKKNSEGVYTIACSARQNAPSLVIHLDGVDAILRPQHFIARLEHVSSGTDGCYSTLVASPNEQVYLGGPFFRAFYIEYALSEKKLLIAESATDGLGALHATAH